MQWLFPSVVSTFCATLIFALTYFYLFYSEKEKYFAVWTISWSIYSLRFACVLIMLQTGQNRFLQIAIQLFPLIGAVLLLYGSGIWLKKGISNYWFVVSIGISIWIVASIIFQFGFLVSTLPSFIVMGAIYILTGVNFIRFHQHKSLGKHITGWAFILWGIHKMDYPLLRPVEWLAPLGFLLAALFTVIAAIGIILIYFEMKKYELQQSEARWKSLTETSPDHIFTLDTDFKIQLANFAAPGLSVQELIGTPLYQYAEGAEKQAEVKAVFENVLKTGKQTSYETEYNTPDGGIIYFESRVVPRKLEGSQEFIGLTVSSRNITEGKQAEKTLESERAFLAAVLDNIEESIIICNDEGLIVRFNEAARRLHGLPEQPIPPDQWAEYYDLRQVDGVTPLSKDDIPLFRALQGDLVHDMEIVVAPKHSNPVFLVCNGQALIDKAGIKIGAVIAMHDITERKQAEEQIKASLKEKETLLQEIHHRVKNNMNVVSGLLSLHKNSTQNEEVKNALQESQGRVYAMSAVHEALYNAQNMAEIDLMDYLNKLSRSLLQTYSVNPGKVQFKISGDDVRVDIEKASPLGLTINELISNALKYAFPDDRKGKIEVILQKQENRLALTIIDDGVGIPEEFDWKNSGSLGLKLVHNLIEGQLNGSVEMDNKTGTRFRIQINLGK